MCSVTAQASKQFLIECRQDYIFGLLGVPYARRPFCFALVYFYFLPILTLSLVTTRATIMCDWYQLWMVLVTVNWIYPFLLPYFVSQQQGKQKASRKLGVGVADVVSLELHIANAILQTILDHSNILLSSADNFDVMQNFKFIQNLNSCRFQDAYIASFTKLKKRNADYWNQAAAFINASVDVKLLRKHEKERCTITIEFNS